MKNFYWLTLTALLFSQTACAGSTEEGFKKIMASKTAPVGVVFEIATGDDTGLDWAIPAVRSYTSRLRERFPGIKIAVVSHGDEQFQLMESNRQRFPDTHRRVASLIQEQNITVHVCGNYAASNGVDDDEFIETIDVAARGPAQVDTYEEAGYEVLVIYRPEKVK